MRGLALFGGDCGNASGHGGAWLGVVEGSSFGFRGGRVDIRVGRALKTVSRRDLWADPGERM